MDGPQLTDEQRAAIATRDVSVALSAGAGCGKTFVLTERFLSHLRPGEATQLAELVAITFTERAAREMRDRIRGRCHQRLLEAATEKEADHWLHISREIESARISTIHAFCASLLRSHAVEAGLDPQFRVLDQSAAETLLAEVIDGGLRRLLARQLEAVMDLIVDYGLVSLKYLIRLLLKQRDRIDFDAWLGRTPDEVLEAWDDYHRTVVVPELLAELSAGEAATQLLKLLADNVPSHSRMIERRDFLLERLPLLANSQDPHADLEAMKAQARVQGGGAKGAWEHEEVYVAVKDSLTDLRGRIESAFKLMRFEREPARGAALAGLQLLEVVQEIDAFYTMRKRELGALDFDDLLIRARDLLVDPRHAELRRQLERQTHTLLVDEFQDTDPLQVELVKALCGDDLPAGKLFFVGDSKQSIYRFRRADPRVFRELQEALPPHGRLPLTLNFRSQPQVLAFANSLFCEEFAEYEPLRAHRPQVTTAPTIEFLWSPAEDPKEKEPSLRRREAGWIARRLRGLLDAGEEIVADEDAGTPRPVRPGDIALLFRALSDVAYYEEALRQYDIDYYLVGGHAFYAQQEIHDLLNLLRTLANPSDHVSLAGVLRSPFFSLADESLYWLSKHSQGLSGGLFGGPPRGPDAAQLRRIEFAATTIKKLRASKDRMTITALIDEALRVTGYDAVLLAEFMGERKLANLRKLVDQARSFDRSGIFTLSDFITQLSDFVADQPDEPLAATLPESTDVVKLMTVHQAKGLEFPVVVVPDLQRPVKSSSPGATFHPELGPLVGPPDTDSKDKEITGYDFLKRIEREEDLAELMRLFYVATTRAADYLILSSGVSRLGEASSPWMSLLARRFDLLTGQFLGESPEEWDVPEVLVTTSEPPLEDGPRRERRPNLRKIIGQAMELAAGSDGQPPASIAPVPLDAAARREYSFSRLGGTLHPTPTRGDDAEADPDEDGQVSRIDPIGLGTLVHAVLEELPFEKTDVDRLVQRHAADHLPGDPEGVTAAAEMVGRFLRSPLANKLTVAKTVYKELEFLLAWPPDEPTAGGIYLRGYIDCLYQGPADAWHLLDYKTNDVTRSTLKSVAANYETQMVVYALAAETVLGQPPESLTLYFLRPGTAYTFKLDAAARRRVITQVNQAIAQYVRREGESSEGGKPSPGSAAVPPSHFSKASQRTLPGFCGETSEDSKPT